MNEIQFLRSQINTEQRHLEAVLRVCTDTLASGQSGADTDAFLRVCADYLTPGVKALVARDRARLDMSNARTGSTGVSESADASRLETLLDQVSTRWAELAGAATELRPALHRATQVLSQLLRAREQVPARLDDSALTVEQWRKAAFVDARSILEERNRYQRVGAALPLGVEELERHGR